MFVDTAGRAPEDKEVDGVHNAREAGLVRSLVAALVQAGVAGEEIGVIAPYSGQVKFIKVRFSLPHKCSCAKLNIFPLFPG